MTTKIKISKEEHYQTENRLRQKNEDFYTTLYPSLSQNPGTGSTIKNLGSEDIPEITNKEIKKALKQIKTGKCPGEDTHTTKILTFGEHSSRNH